MTGRSIPEWVGKTPDAKIPERVKLRIWRREDGRCHITGQKIMPGDEYEYEHKKRLADGGKHAESNIFLALKAPHKEKSAEEKKHAAKADRIAKRHVGIVQPKGQIKSPGFPAKPEKPGKVDKTKLPPLPRRSLYEDAR